MATIFEQLEQGLSGLQVDVKVGGQVASLAAVATAASELASDPPDSIADFGAALAELPLPRLEAESDLLEGLGAVREALPGDLPAVTAELTALLQSLGTIVTELTGKLDVAIDAALGVARLGQVDLRCAGPSGGGPEGGGPLGDAPLGAPTPNPNATAPLDDLATALGLLPETLDVEGFLERLHGWLEFPERDSLFPAVVPVLDEVRDPLRTLVAWRGMTVAKVRTSLNQTIAAAASLMSTRIERALSALTVDLAAVAPQLPTAALGTAASGVAARLGDLDAAVESGDLSGTGPTVTELNGLLDGLDAIRAEFAVEVAPRLPALLQRLPHVDAELEDALVVAVAALNPPSTLDVLQPLSRLVLENAAETPVKDFQDWLGSYISWLQDLLVALDLSAVQAPLETAAAAARDTLASFDQAVAGVTVTVQELFSEVESAVDVVDTAGLVARLQAALDEFEAELDGRLTELFTPVREGVGAAIAAVGDAVDGFDPVQIVAVLNEAMTTLQGILSGGAEAAAEIGTTLQAGAEQVQTVSFAPIVDDVVRAIDEVTAALELIDNAQLTAPMQVALQAALVVLPESLEPITGPLVVEFDAAVDGSAIPALGTLRGQPQRLLDEVKRFEPATLVGDELSQPFQALLSQMKGFTPGSLLDPVRQQLDAVKERLRENVDPAQVLEPLQAPFGELMATFDSLRPEQIVQPLQAAVDTAVSTVLEAVPVDETFQQLDEALGRVQDTAAIGDRVVAVLERTHQLLAGFADAPAQVAAWLEPILAKVDEAGGHASLQSRLDALTAALAKTRAAELLARVDGAVDPVLEPLTELDPHASLAAIVQAKNGVSRAKLNAFPDSAEKTAIAAVLDRFDPLSDGFGRPFESLRDLATALSGAKTSTHSLLGDAWDANYTGPNGLLADLQGLAAGPAVGQSVREFVERRFTGPLDAVFALTVPLAAGTAAVLAEVKKLVDDLDARLAVLLTGPGSLGEIKTSLEGLVGRLRAVDLAFLTTSLTALFANVRGKLAALDPAALAGSVSAAFDQLVNELDLAQALPAGEVAQLDADFKAVTDKLALLDPKALVTDVVQPGFDATVAPVLAAFDLSLPIDALVERLGALKEELRVELDRVEEAYQRMRDAIPAMDLGDIAGAAAAAVGDLAGSVEVSF